jgi:hypothetical protein
MSCDLWWVPAWDNEISHHGPLLNYITFFMVNLMYMQYCKDLFYIFTLIKKLQQNVDGHHHSSN